MSEKDPYLDNSELWVCLAYFVIMVATLAIVGLTGRSSDEYSRDHNPCVCKDTP